jgi:uncharacterized membrane protein YhaH (DUF805 family)
MLLGVTLASRTSGSVGLLILCGLLMIAVGIAAAWAGLALQARRFRDIGWNPLYVMPPLLTIGVFDALVARMSPALSVGPMHQQTIVGLLVNLAAGGCLLFWPSHTDEGDDDPISRVQPTMPDEPAEREPAPVARPAAPAWNAAPARAGFGRRGL